MHLIILGSELNLKSINPRDPPQLTHYEPQRRIWLPNGNSSDWRSKERSQRKIPSLIGHQCDRWHCWRCLDSYSKLNWRIFNLIKRWIYVNSIKNHLTEEFSINSHLNIQNRWQDISYKSADNKTAILNNFESLHVYLNNHSSTIIRSQRGHIQYAI